MRNVEAQRRSRYGGAEVTTAAAPDKSEPQNIQCPMSNFEVET